MNRIMFFGPQLLLCFRCSRAHFSWICCRVPCRPVRTIQHCCYPGTTFFVVAQLP